MNITEITYDTKDDDIMIIEISYLFLLIFTIPCFLSLVCCLSFSIYSFIKFLKK